MAGVIDLREGTGVGVVDCVVDSDGNSRDLVTANSGLLKGDEKYVQTSKVGLVLDSDR